MTDVAGQTNPFDHPLIDDLIAFADGELDKKSAAEIAGHVEQCVTCRAVLERVGPPIALMSPEPVALFSFTPFAALPVSGEPAVGEVWQLDWADAAVLAAVVESYEDGVGVVPISREGSQDESFSIAVEMFERPDRLFVWHRLASTVPLGVFSYPVGRLSDGSQRRVSESLAAGVLAQAVSVVDVALGRDRSMPVVDVLFEADMAVAVASLADASWVPESSAALVPLGELLRERALMPTTVEAATGIPAASITELVRERREATEEEAVALASVLQLPVDRVRRQPAVPAALAHAVERPAHRASVRLRALQGGLSEASARLQVAQEALALSARTSGAERDVETWDELVRHSLDA